MLIQRQRCYTLLIIFEFKMEKVVNFGTSNVGEQIFEACASGKTKTVQLLLQRYKSEDRSFSNIELNAKDTNGWTVFMVACFNGHPDVVKLLLDHSDRNIELNARMNTGMTAFMLACYNGQTDVVKLLLYHSGSSIDVNAKTTHGWTAFMLACFRGHTDVVKLFWNHSDV